MYLVSIHLPPHLSFKQIILRTYHRNKFIAQINLTYTYIFKKFLTKDYNKFIKKEVNLKSYFFNTSSIRKKKNDKRCSTFKFI